MAQSDVVKGLAGGKIEILDGSTLVFEIDVEPGDFNYTPPTYATITIPDRAEIHATRKGAKSPGSCTFSAYFRSAADASNAVLVDVIDGTNTWSGRVSTNTDHEEFVCTVRYTAEGTALGDSKDHVLTITEVKLTYTFAEGDLSTVSVSGEVFGTHTWS